MGWKWFWQMGIMGLLFMGFGHLLPAQERLHHKVDIERGLPTNEVYEIVQDDFGFLWIACNSGLIRYNGASFHAIPVKSGKGRAMVNVFKDANGGIWSKNTSGQLFHLKGDTLFSVFDVAGTGKNSLLAFANAGGGYLMEGRKVWRLDAEGMQYELAEVPIAQDEAFYPIAISENAAKLYLALGPAGVWIFDLRTKQWDRPVFTGLDFRNVIGGGFQVLEEGMGYWAPQPKSQLIQFYIVADGKTQIAWELQNPSNEVRFLRGNTGREGEVWVCTNMGLLSIEKAGGRYELKDWVWKDFQASSALQDLEGNQWISTLNGGLLMVPPETAYRWMPLSRDWDAHIVALAQSDAGEILAGTYGGFLLRKEENGLSLAKDLDLPAARPITIKKIRQKGEGWLVAQRISRYSQAGRAAQIGLAANARDLVMDGDRLYEVGPEGALWYRWNPKSKLLADSLHFISQSPGHALHLEEGSGKLYFALSDGLYIWDGQALQALKMAESPIMALSFSGDAEATWVGTQAQGLLRFKNGELLEQIEMNELAEGEALRIVRAEDDLLAIAAETKLLIYDAAQKELSEISARLGIAPADINDLLLHDGQLWLATHSGILSIALEAGKENLHSPALRIGSLSLDHAQLQAQSDLRLPYAARNLRIELEGCSFRSRGNFGFEYRIQGLQEDWIYLPASASQVLIPSLPSGDFVFEARLIEFDGRRSADKVTLAVHVARPFFLEWWFLLLIFLGVGTLFYAGFMARLAYIRRKDLLKQQYLASQLTALKAQMNPHFMFNAINSIQSLVISKDIRNSNLYLSKFSSLMRKVLEASGHEWVRLSDEVEMLQLYLDLEKLRFGDEFEFVVQLDEKGNSDPEMPSMIVQPFVENAVKHGLLHRKGPKRLVLTFEIGEGLVCTVEDNGVGRKRSAEINARSGRKHKSFSTEATSERLSLIRRLYGKRVSLEILDLEENAQAIGTKVVIKLPLKP